MIPRVLSIAGTDPTGGAGIQADLKSIAAHGGYGMAAVTSLVAQNTHGVRSVHTPPPSFLAEQLDAVSDDVEIDAVKIGMLGDAATVRIVREWLERVRPPRVVLDPVMVATSGDRLLAAEAEEALRELLPLADVVTPNAPELGVLVGRPAARDTDGLLDQARLLAESSGTLVVAKGGHVPGPLVVDALVGREGALARFESPRIDTSTTHGTGCSLSAAIATLAARDDDWTLAVGRARDWLAAAIAEGPRLRVGTGNGPVHHLVEIERVLPGAGPITSAWWRDIAELRARIDALPFVRSLADGTLAADTFRWYLAEDAAYLAEYATHLARAAELAPRTSDAAFWRAGSVAAREEAERLHLRWTAATADAAPATRAYLDHLARSADRGYEVLIAALLPCYWIYADIGRRMPSPDPAHPYAAWVQAYADPSFAAATRRATATVECAARAADPVTLVDMREAFVTSAQHEHAFFAAP
ncbi:bifunctional hydroxymethylpyrimidine kinase/phosphomethylpyrimidine kinase [Microbacterium petrolearium]